MTDKTVVELACKHADSNYGDHGTEEGNRIWYAAMMGFKAGHAAARAQPSTEAPQWLPIESAPKDGSCVLLGRFTGDLKDEYEGRIDRDYWHSGKNSFTGWGKFNPTYWPPTHWMPLPKPPEESK